MLHPIVKPVLRTSLIGYVCVVVSLPMKRHRDIGAPAREPYKLVTITGKTQLIQQSMT